MPGLSAVGRRGVIYSTPGWRLGVVGLPGLGREDGIKIVHNPAGIDTSFLDLVVHWTTTVPSLVAQV